MVIRLASAIGRLAGNVGGAALGAIGDLGKSVSDDLVVTLINRLADQFEAVTVPVRCVPTSTNLNQYKLEADLTAFEAALEANRFVRPRIEVHAASTELNRVILTNRLIETFSVMLVQHEERMRSLEERKRRRLEKHNADLSWSLAGTTVDFFLNAAILAFVGLGALVGPMFWLLVGLGGISILAELPDIAWSALKSAVGIKEGDDKEIYELKQRLERQRPLLERLVKEATIVEDAELKSQHAAF
ncbi:hypothetical protein KC887_03780 [Candidatus Kaiserbacteria bacterium]|nr:hypothetical protein [Candidatus Kaiserbacteria bacterium]